MRTISTLYFAFATFTILPASASASCSNLQDLLDKAYPSAVRSEHGFEIDGGYRQLIDPNTAACSIWPARPDLTVLAIPRIESHPSAEYETRGDIEMIIANTKSGNIVGRYVEKGAALSAAITFDSVGLDTGRYDIKSGQRAFGFRAHYSHRSNATPFSETVLWLYSFDEKAISPVLEGLRVEIGRGENNQNCTGFFEATMSVITPGKPGLRAYRALIIDQSTSTETTKPGDEDCLLVSKNTAHKRYVLHYGDPHYGVFDGKGAFKDASYNDLFSAILSDR